MALKVQAAIRHGLIPLICGGETLLERDAGRADAVLQAQVRAALSLLAPAEAAAPIRLACEPVWAIGPQGSVARPDYAGARHAPITATARQVPGRAVPCLCGSVVGGQNCRDLIAQPHIGGLFIGCVARSMQGYPDILRLCRPHRSRVRHEAGHHCPRRGPSGGRSPAWRSCSHRRHQ